MILKSDAAEGTLGGKYVKYINGIDLHFTAIIGIGYEKKDYKNLFQPNSLVIKTIFLPFISISFSKMIIRGKEVK